jgi:hypothetical protein
MRGWSPLLEWNWYLKVGRTLHPRLVMLFFFWNDLWPVGTEAATFSAVLRPDGRPLYFDVPVDANWIWYKHVRLVRLIEETWRRIGLADLKRAFSSLACGTIAAGHARRAAGGAIARAGPALQPRGTPGAVDVAGGGARPGHAPRDLVQLLAGDAAARRVDRAADTRRRADGNRAAAFCG